MSTPISQLKEYCDLGLDRPKYHTIDVRGGFLSQVTVNKIQYYGEIRGTKKEAEHSVAAKALKELIPTPKKIKPDNVKLWVDTENMPKFLNQLREHVDLSDLTITQIVSKSYSGQIDDSMIMVGTTAQNAADLAIVMDMTINMSKDPSGVFVLASKDKFSHTFESLINSKVLGDITIHTVCNISQMMELF